MDRTRWAGKPLLLLFVVAAALLFSVSAAQAQTTISTIGSWTGESINFFGSAPDGTPTYGQTVTVPATETVLQNFTFEMYQETTVLFRGEVYAWDDVAGHATGSALWEGQPTHTTDGNNWQEITFNTGGVPVTPGAKYVLFATALKDTSTGRGSWGSIAADIYSGGEFVFSNDTNFAALLTSTWSSVGGSWNFDLAFSATFGTLVNPLTPTDGADQNVTEGSALTAATLGTFADTDASATASSFTASTDWGDNTTSTGTVTGSNGSFTVTGTHIYKEEGDYNVATTVTDASDNQAVIHTIVHVADAPITITSIRASAKTVRATLNSLATLTVKFTDANPYATADDFSTSSIDWGNGTSTATIAKAGKTWSATGTNTYYIRGTSYEITITIEDIGGQTATKTTTVYVR